MISIITDRLYTLLPIPIVWNVKMSVQAKVTVVVLGFLHVQCLLIPYLSP
jgi:hypothetical protein